jgi:hypothetical protein
MRYLIIALLMIGIPVMLGAQQVKPKDVQKVQQQAKKAGEQVQADSMLEKGKEKQAVKKVEPQEIKSNRSVSKTAKVKAKVSAVENKEKDKEQKEMKAEKAGKEKEQELKTSKKDATDEVKGIKDTAKKAPKK